ncbi:hypothetical protein Tco_0879780 [Tanacetum coccineum]
MGDENQPHTLRDYSKPSHEGYRNTSVLPKDIDVSLLRPNTIRLVHIRCAFHRFRPENLNQHLKDFLKSVDSIDLNGASREIARLHLFQVSLREQASNWLERLPSAEESWEVIEGLALYNNKSWNDLRDLDKLVKAISLPSDVPSTSD